MGWCRLTKIPLSQPCLNAHKFYVRLLKIQYRVMLDREKSHNKNPFFNTQHSEMLRFIKICPTNLFKAVMNIHNNER